MKHLHVYNISIWEPLIVCFGFRTININPYSEFSSFSLKQLLGEPKKIAWILSNKIKNNTMNRLLMEPSLMWITIQHTTCTRLSLFLMQLNINMYGTISPVLLTCYSLRNIYKIFSTQIMIFQWMFPLIFMEYWPGMKLYASPIVLGGFCLDRE